MRVRVQTRGGATHWGGWEEVWGFNLKKDGSRGGLRVGDGRRDGEWFELEMWLVCLDGGELV